VGKPLSNMVLLRHVYTNECTACCNPLGKIFHRKQFCRVCGELICEQCSTKRINFVLVPKKLFRACDTCYNTTYYKNHLEEKTAEETEEKNKKN